MRTDVDSASGPSRQSEARVDILDVLSGSSDPATMAVALYLFVMNAYISIFTSTTLSLRERCQHVGIVLGYLSCWALLNQNEYPGKSWKHHFLTTQTTHDIIISVSCILLFIMMNYEECGSSWDLYASRLSSRFLEYLFSYCRGEHKNASGFGVYAGLIHLNHFLYTLQLELKYAGDLPTTRRGFPRGEARIKPASASERTAQHETFADATDIGAAIVAAVDAGVEISRRKAIGVFAGTDDAAAIRLLLTRTRVRNGVNLLGPRKTVAADFFDPGSFESGGESGGEGEDQSQGDGGCQDEGDGEDEDEDEVPPPRLLGAGEFTYDVLMKMKQKQLETILKNRGAPHSGSKSSQVERIIALSLLGDAVDAALQGDTDNQEPAKPTTRKEEEKDRYFAAVETALGEVEARAIREAGNVSETTHDDGDVPAQVKLLFEAVLFFARLVNLAHVRLSRERSGYMSRFVEQRVLRRRGPTNDSGPPPRVTPLHLAICGKRFEDVEGRWRVVDENDGLDLDGVFYDEEADQIFVLKYRDGTPSPRIDDIHHERYDSVMSTAVWLDDSD